MLGGGGRSLVLPSWQAPSRAVRTLLENREVLRPPIFSHLLAQVIPLHPHIELMQHDVG